MEAAALYRTYLCVGDVGVAMFCVGDVEVNTNCGVTLERVVCVSERVMMVYGMKSEGDIVRHL